MNSGWVVVRCFSGSLVGGETLALARLEGMASGERGEKGDTYLVHQTSFTPVFVQLLSLLVGNVVPIGAAAPLAGSPLPASGAKRGERWCLGSTPDGVAGL